SSLDSPQPPRAPQGKPRRKWLLPVIIAAVLVVLGGSGALAYKFWYQNPKKVISDGFMHAIEAKSISYKVTAERKDTSMAVKVVLSGISRDGANSVDANVEVMSDGKTHAFKGSAVIDKKSNIYIKVANVDTLLAEFTATMPASVRQEVDAFIKKINDQWIVISNDKLKSFSESYAKSQECLQKVSDTIQKDQSYSNELVDLYKKHPFFKITKELGSKDGSLGYEVQGDKVEGKAFGEGLKNTKTYKLMHDCDSSFKIDTNNQDSSDEDSTAQIWVSRWSHEITKITANEKGDDNSTTTVGVEPIFNKAPEVKTPANAKSVEDLMNDLQTLQMNIMEASLQESQAANGSLFS
ncbi:MAG TPA: hypothetical protein VFS14_03785, partial [Candidatus Saccharimonadales bacterium]|nr:hypothetical protein [Candidatus Saccharimonadales bacterium]